MRLRQDVVCEGQGSVEEIAPFMSSTQTHSLTQLSHKIEEASSCLLYIILCNITSL